MRPQRYTYLTRNETYLVKLFYFYFFKHILVRYERKYKIDKMHASSVKQAIRMMPHGFKRAFEDRVVNNIYFDNPDYVKLRENRDGIANRNKLRVRWYGKELGDDLTLEIKGKKNELGTKEHFKIDLNSINNLGELTEAVKISCHKKDAKMYPVIINQYQRSYFVTADKKIRITVDEKLRFFPLFNKSLSISLNQINEFKSHLWYETPSVILEMKYEKDAFERANKIGQILPFRLTKYSKYAMGLQHLFNASV